MIGLPAKCSKLNMERNDVHTPGKKLSRLNSEIAKSPETHQVNFQIQTHSCYTWHIQSPQYDSHPGRNPIARATDLERNHGAPLDSEEE